MMALANRPGRRRGNPGDRRGVAILAMLLAAPDAAAFGQTGSVALRHGIVPDGSHVVAIDLVISGARIAGIAGMPAGWTLVSDAGTGDRFRLNGGNHAREDALDDAGLAAITLTYVARNQDPPGPLCSGTLVLTADFRHTTERRVTPRDCVAGAAVPVR